MHTVSHMVKSLINEIEFEDEKHASHKSDGTSCIKGIIREECLGINGTARQFFPAKRGCK